MKVFRGDVVLIDHPYSSGQGSKVRPVLVVQNNRDNQRLSTTIIVQITSTTRRSLESTQLAIILDSPEGQLSGLRQDSVVNTVNILTISQAKILRRLGNLPTETMQALNACLQKTLAL